MLNEETEKFVTTQGVRQGGVLSPLLFVLFLNEVITECSEKSKKINVGYHRMRTVCISECVFADDIVVIANNEEALQHNIELWINALSLKGMSINTKKTKTMVISNTRKNINIKIEGRQVEQVSNIRYLGTIIDEKGDYAGEINSRIASTTNLYHMMKNEFIGKREISVKTKTTVYKAIYLPTLLYGCESWVTTERLHQKLQAAEMKYLRRVAGFSLLDKIRNDTIRNKLEMESARTYLQRAQLRWWGHLNRLPRDRQVRRVWEARKPGKRRRGRPRREWDGEVGELLKGKQMTWKEAAALTSNRTLWRKIVNEV